MEIAEFFLGPIAIPYFKPLWLNIIASGIGFLIYLVSLMWLCKWTGSSNQDIPLTQEHDINKVPKELRGIL